MAIDPRVAIGHVHLKVADIDRALAFWSGVLGFELQQRIGDQAAFVAAGGYHHHIGLNTWESRGAPPAALNPVDVSIGSGRFYGGSPETPYVIGSEVVGRTSDGRRVWYYARGTMAERVTVEQPDHAVEIPDGVDDELAIACGIAGVTGWLAVSWRAKVTPE